MTRLAREERGAIMLIALAFAIFGVAMLYYAVGLAQTILLREKLQDAADATALSSAVVHARTMNFLVLLNIIMAALLAVLIAFKLVETLAIVGIIIAAALAWVSGGSTLSAIPPLKVVQSEMRSLYDTTKEPIFNALEVLHDAADAVVLVAPGAAQSVARADLAASWQPDVSPQGAVADGAPDLPVEDDRFDHLCKRGGELAGGLAMKPLPLPGAIKGAVEDALGGLTGSMSGWFCGDSGGRPPTPPPQRVNKRFPRTEEMDLCQNEELSAKDLELAARDPEGFQTDACKNSARDVDAAEPDDMGACRNETDCSERGPYETHAQLARAQCDPTSKPAPFAYRYQQQTGHVVYTYSPKLGWLRGEPVLDRPTVVETRSPACGPASVRPTVATRYNDRVRDPQSGEPRVLCSDEAPPSAPPRANRATAVTVKFTNVNEILSCQKTVEEPVESGDAASSGDAGDAKFPKKVKSGLLLGTDPFQTRVLVRAARRSPADRIVRLALWSAKAPEIEGVPGDELRGFGLAQAEYFFDGDEPAGDWMWSMKWRGRLRRFHLPTTTESSATLLRECLAAFGKDGALLAPLESVEANIAH